ncbi:hypothetical protein MKW92_007097 [Papaver armeniacum]|nr:hypothetical protein MKW92_007097 [Papaver armeniacum]
MSSPHNLGQLSWDNLLSRQEKDRDSYEIIRKEIIRRCPEVDTELYGDQWNLIHLASEHRNVEMVKELLSTSPCFRYDKDLKSLLEYAAMKGNMVVVQLLLDALPLTTITCDEKNALVVEALYFALRGNQHQAFHALAIKYMEMKNWDSKKVTIIKTTNKVILHIFLFIYSETPSPSDDIPTEVLEALHEKLMSTIRRQDWPGYASLEKFLASNPLLFKALSSRFCPLETQFYICVLTGQTDDLLDEIYRVRFEFGPVEGEDPTMHRVVSWGYFYIVKLILIYESGSSSVCVLKDRYGDTPLHRAVQIGKVSVINMLLSTCWESAGILSDRNNETALHGALKENNTKPFKTLLEWYIIKEEFLNHNARDWDCGVDTALDLLVDGYVKIVKELLGRKDSKICFQRESREGMEYFVVIKCKNKEIIGTIKYQDYIREVTSKTTNRTILSLSMDSRSIITLKVLIRSDMVRWILDARDLDGNTVFDLLSITEEVYIRPANVMGFVPYERYENVIWLLDAMKMGDYKAFSKLLVEDPQILDYVCDLPLKGTPLHIAARFGQLNDCTREIIRKKPVFAAMKDHNSLYPLHVASAKGNLEIVKELLTQFGFNQCFSGDSATRERKAGDFYETPLEHAIQTGKISVINELLCVWWKCIGVESRERDLVLLRVAADSIQFEALKMLMERYIEDELLKAKEVDGNPMSALADGYIKIVLKHLLSPKVNYSLSILVKYRGDGKTIGTTPPLNLYFAVIKVTSNNRREKNNIIDELKLSAYYPKYFQEVTVQNKMVLCLSMDNENEHSVTLKLLLRSPLFNYQHRTYGRYGYYANKLFDFGSLLKELRNEVHI